MWQDIKNELRAAAADDAAARQGEGGNGQEGNGAEAPAPRRWRRVSRRGLPIVVVLSVSFGALVALAVGLLFLAAYQVASRNTLELVQDKAELITGTMVLRVRDYLDPAQAELDFLGELIAEGRIDPDDDAALGEMMLASLAGVPQVSVMGFVYPDLRILRAFRARPDPAVALDDWSDDPQVARIMEQQSQLTGSAWGELFVAESVGQTYINVRRPVRDAEGNFLGSLVAGVPLEELSRFLGELAEDYTYNPFILYDRNYVLAHALLRGGYPGLSDEKPLPDLEMLSDPVLRGIWSEQRDLEIESSFSEPVQVRAVELERGTFVFLFRELDGYAEKPMTVGTYLHMEDVASPLKRLLLIPQIGLGILFATLVCAALLGRTLSRPASRLAEAALSIRNLDLDNARRIPVGLFRELNLAGEAFNSMLDGLKRFETYVPRSLVQRMIRRGGTGRIAPEDRDVTVMFTDIVGFTTRAEHLPARAVASFLNDHFTLISDCAEAEDGTIDKYIGDAMMVFWGAPEHQEDHADRACQAALRIAEALGESNRRRIAQGEDIVRLRIGIHSGPAIVGDIGAPTRVNYTVIGDTVNTAERLETLSRDLVDAELEICTLISAETAGRLSRRLGLRRFGEHRLPGREELVKVLSLESEQPLEADDAAAEAEVSDPPGSSRGTSPGAAAYRRIGD